MGRLFDEDELQKYIMHDGCDKGCGYIDERDLKYIHTIEAIPKEQYETRLKADMVAMLTEIQLEIEKCVDGAEGSPQFEQGVTNAREQVVEMIQEKINELKVESENT